MKNRLRGRPLAGDPFAQLVGGGVVLFNVAGGVLNAVVVKPLFGLLAGGARRVLQKQHGFTSLLYRFAVGEFIITRFACVCQSRTVCKKGFPPWRRESFAVYLVVVGCLGGVAGDLGLDELLLDLRQTSTGGDELTDDDVLLQAGQRVDLALDGGLGQDTGGLLEGRSGQEGVGSQSWTW